MRKSSIFFLNLWQIQFEKCPKGVVFSSKSTLNSAHCNGLDDDDDFSEKVEQCRSDEGYDDDDDDDDEIWTVSQWNNHYGGGDDDFAPCS